MTEKKSAPAQIETQMLNGTAGAKDGALRVEIEYPVLSGCANAARLNAFYRSRPGRTRVNKKYFINMLKEFERMKVATNDWNDVVYARESEKVGFWRGSFKNIRSFIFGNQDVEKKIDMAKTSQLVHMLDTIGTYSRYAQNPLIRLEIALQPICAYFFVPLFAFANAGVTLEGNIDISLNSVMLGTILGLVVGKPDRKSVV